MERIIINEIDNTSNVESLSSYDVAYVPGFALGPNGSVNSSLYRNPTLVTNRYEFVNMFGSAVPTFGTLQHYPAAFETVAKTVDGSTEISYYQTRVNEFVDEDAIVASNYYDFVQTAPAATDANILQYYVAAKSQNQTIYTLEAVGAGNDETTIQKLNTKVFGKKYYTIEGGTAKSTLAGENPLGPFYTYTAEDAEEEIKARYTNVTTTIAQEFTGTSFVEGTDYFVIDTETNNFRSITTAERAAGPVDNISYYIINSEITAFYTPTVTEFTGDTFASGTMYFEGLLNDYIQTEDESPIRSGSEVLNNHYAFSSVINPSTYPLFVVSGQTYAKSADTYIHPNTAYFIRTAEGEILMFEEGDADPGYRYALTLLSMGMPVYFEQMNQSSDDINVEIMYNGLAARFVTDPDEPDYSFDSIGDYSIKFITSGGYPTFEYNNNSIAIAMEEMASSRADAIALIDHTDNPSRDITAFSTSNSVINAVRSGELSTPAFGTYGAMFTPWYHCSHVAVTGENAEIPNTTMPGSLAYLTALAVQLQNYNPWLAVSGVTRGAVPYCAGLHTNKPLTNNIADTYQVLPGESTFTGAAICINPITYIRNYGYCIWGNRTLHNNSTSGTKASSFLNLRSAVSDIKKRLFEVSQRLLFEQNTDLLWLNFQSMVTPLLETMVSDYILSDYAITRLLIDPNTGAAVPAYEVMAIIRIQPVNSVEIFNLTIVMENSDTLTITTSEE